MYKIKYRILSIGASDLAINLNTSNITDYPGYLLAPPLIDQRILEMKLTSVIDPSIELEHLYKVKRRTSHLGDTITGSSDYYLYDLISINFKYSLKNFNRSTFSFNIYELLGHSLKKEDLIGKNDDKSYDGILIKNNELIGILLNEEIKNPILDLGSFENGKYFVYDSITKCYKRSDKQFKTVLDCELLRKWLYEKGFDFLDKHYVRYKRSAGSSREGVCLFIEESLKTEMMKPSEKFFNDFKYLSKENKVSYEAYNALTLSSIVDTIEIKKENILIIKDYKSLFNNDCIVVSKNDDEILESCERNIEISNKIWDGEGLLDSDYFKNFSSSLEHFQEGSSMMLLRNYFFKSCVFNTKLSLFFSDFGIKNVSQLNKDAIISPMPKSISDIKLIFTESSLKLLGLINPIYKGTNEELKAKKEIVKRWLDKCPSLFGIVKTDKQTSFFDGRIVQTNYQLLNTLPLTKDDIESFLKESRKYYDDIQLHPEVMAFYLNYNYYKDAEEIDEKDDEESEENTFNFDNLPHVYQDKFKIVSKLLGLNEDFPKTNLYRDFRSNVRSTLYDKLKKGKVLVRGTNATIFSNGYEMLLYIINKLNDKYKPILKDNEVFSYFFNEGEELCLGRSPHITMGNVYYAKNVKEPEPIKKYFVLSKEIIYFNSINNNVMNRLNDCDFDSDSLLITNDSHLVTAAKKVYQNFKVPVNGLPSSAKDLDLYKIDYNISSNKIGQIVNFSQLLNSIYWDSSTRENVNINREELYKDICILSILSGVEIDKAKRDYDVNVPEVIKKLKEKYLKGFYETNRPFFFNHRILDILSSSTKKIENVPFSTTMDYICDAAKNKAFVQRKREGTVSFQDLVNHSSNTNLSSYNRKKVKESRDIIEKYYIEYNKICAKYKGDDTFNQRKDDWLCRLLKDFEDYLTNNDCIYKLLSSIDTKDMIKYFWIILYFIFNRDKNNANFYKQVFKEKTDNLYKLVIDDDAINPDFEYYGIKLVKEKV